MTTIYLQEVSKIKSLCPFVKCHKSNNKANANSFHPPAQVFLAQLNKPPEAASCMEILNSLELDSLSFYL
jgi:hypothetical protein